MKTFEQRIASLRSNSCDRGLWIRQFGEEALEIILELQQENQALQDKLDQSKKIYEEICKRMIREAIEATSELDNERIKSLQDKLEGAWQPIETRPKDECVPFLVALPKNYVADFVAIQVSNFEGEMYPDHLNGLVNWNGRVLNATHWMPLPTPPKLTGDKNAK